MPVPAVPRASLVVSKSKLRLSRLERVLDGPTPPLNRHQGGDPGPGRAPGREEGKLAIVQAAADQKSACPQAGEGLVVFGRIQVGQLAISPVIQPLAFRAVLRRQALPGPLLSPAAIASAAPATGGFLPQELNTSVAL